MDLLTDNIKQSILPTMWQYLPFLDLIRFGRSAKIYSKILKDSNTWIYLLERDYSVKIDHFNPQEYYEYLFLIRFQHPESNDRMLIKKLRQYMPPGENCKYWVFNTWDSDSVLVATISGFHLYEVLLKTLIHIELPRHKTTLQEYLHKFHGYTYLEKHEFNSLLSSLTTSFHNQSRDVFIRPVISLPTY